MSHEPTIGELLRAAAGAVPDRTALALPGAEHSYADVLDGAEEVARGLLALGVRPGDHVGVLMPNSVEFVHAFFGCQLIGAVTVAINARYRQRELSYAVEHADLKVLLTTDVIDEHVDFVGRLQGALPGLAEATDPTRVDLTAAPLLDAVVLLGSGQPAGVVDAARFSELAASVSRDDVGRVADRVGPDDTALMLFTSGTSSQPKGCLLGHASMIRTWRQVGRRFGVHPGECIWNPCPMFHMAGIGPMLFTFELEGTLATLPHFEPALALDQVVAHRPVVLYSAFPTMTMAMVTHPSWSSDLLDSVRVIQNVAPPETLRDMQALFPGTLQSTAYGMTETSGITSFTDIRDEYDDRVETCGLPLEGAEVRVVDPATGLDLPPGDPGELLVRGSVLFQGYHREPDGASVDEDGWLHTGDLGALAPDGRVRYQGRIKEMLKVGGENVAPAEIEAHLSTHPDVRLAQVIGREDPTHAEVPVAFVELVDAATVSSDELISWCRDHLAGFKVPREVHVVREWPMSATKVQKHRLHELLPATPPTPA